MSYIEAVIVLTLILKCDDEADRLAKFMVQFPEHAELAREQWQDLTGRVWED